MYAAQSQAVSPKFTVTLRKAYGFGSMVMSMIGFDGQSAVFAFPGATMGAMGAAAMSRSRGSDVDEAEMLRSMELEASYRSAESLGFDELIDPVTRETCCSTHWNVRFTVVRRRLSRWLASASCRRRRVGSLVPDRSAQAPLRSLA